MRQQSLFRPDRSLSCLLTVILLLTLSGCGNPSESTNAPSAERTLRTWLLVRAPDRPLPLNQPIVVRSQTEDNAGVSHVELYAVQLPTGESNILLNTQPASLNQRSFTAEQTIVPTQRGHYAIKVVGYNTRGEQAESETISFEVQ